MGAWEIFHKYMSGRKGAMSYVFFFFPLSGKFCFPTTVRQFGDAEQFFFFDLRKGQTLCGAKQNKKPKEKNK